MHPWHSSQHHEGVRGTPAKYRIDWSFYLSELAQIVSVGPGICPQKGQRDNFTREPPCWQQSILGPPVCMKPSLTSVSRRPDTHGSYFTLMPVESWTEMSIAGKDQHVKFLGRLGYRRATEHLRMRWRNLWTREKNAVPPDIRRWSVVPNESSRDFGPCDRFWTQLALRCFLLPTLPPGTALRERYVGP